MRKGHINYILIATSLCGVALSLAMTGCSNKVNVNSAKTALQAINRGKNFTLEYQGAYYKEHTYYFTEKSIGMVSNKFPELSDIYYFDGKGTYEITYFDGEYVGSEYRTKSGVWGAKLHPTLKGVASSYINALDGANNTLKIVNKEYYAAFMQVIGNEASDAVYIDEFVVSYDTAKKALTFNVNYNRRIITYVAYNFYSTVNPVVKEYVDNGGRVFKAPKDLKDMKNAMLSNNYWQGVYQMGENEASTGYFYDYIFHPHYWAWYFRSSRNMTGYISLHCNEETGGENPHPALKGIYSWNYVDGTLGINPHDLTGNESTDIIAFMNYPSTISLWDNIHKFLPYDEEMFPNVETLGQTVYYTNDEALVIEFCNNFNMEGAFPGQEPLAVIADIVYEEKTLDMVVFRYMFKYGAYTYEYPIPFYNFGKANIPFMDQVYSIYHTVKD